MGKHINIAVGKGDPSWQEKLGLALDAKIAQGHPVHYAIVDLGQHDWLEAVAPYDVIIWKPSFMGPRSTGLFKEKIYLLERYLAKLVVPNFDTIWHFDSKVAQSYIFACKGIPMPQTTASFDYCDAMECLAQAEMPLVFKKSFGASSRNVQLVTSKRDAERIISRQFCQQRWDASKERHHSTIRRLLASVATDWFWSKVWQKIVSDDLFGVVYWQEFVPGNLTDLRITIIGNCYAYGFWRNNRPNDFRASGSGDIDYERSIPEYLIRYCMNVNDELGFDSMAYDIIFDRDGKFVITEMSYGYIDWAPFKASGHYTLGKDGKLTFEEGHTWPEELWVEWALRRAQYSMI